MTPTTPARTARLLVMTGMLAVSAALALADRTGTARAPVGQATPAASGHAGIAHPAAITNAAQARIRRYWTAARMAHARLPGPQTPADIPSASAPWSAAPARGLIPASAVHNATATAGWPGGGAVARSTGKVFFTMSGQDYVCSGTAVVSANTNVVITAAHCVKNGTGTWAANWVFVPGFSNGTRPYGTWPAAHFFVPSQWNRTASDDDDLAFVTLNPQRWGGRNAYIGQVVGGQNIAFGQRPGQAYAFGYPAEPPYDGTGLYYCSGHAEPDPYHLTQDSGLRCDLTAGSSGGPWLSGFDPITGAGTITSISSFKYDTDQAILYGPRLGPVASALFDQAQHSP